MAEPLSATEPAVTGLTVTELTGIGLATVMARRGVPAAAIGACLGLDAPTGPRAAGTAELTLIGTGPGTWLAQADQPTADWADTLAGRLAGLAAVAEVSAAWRLFRLAGPGAAIALRRGAFVDIAAPGFAPGSVAVTAIAHIGVIIRQTDAAPVYEVAVPRSLAESWRHWLAEVVEA